MHKDFTKAPECILYTCCGSKCKKRGGKHLYKLLKSKIKERHLRRKIQVIKTGCTDRCKMGPVVAVMPANKWHFEVSEEKALEILHQNTNQ